MKCKTVGVVAQLFTFKVGANLASERTPRGLALPRHLHMQARQRKIHSRMIDLCHEASEHIEDILRPSLLAEPTIPTR